MNRYYHIRRRRGAAFLILIGVLALLNQRHIIGWQQSWPSFLILFGILLLIERIAWSADVRNRQEPQNFASASGMSEAYSTASAPGTGYSSPTAPQNGGETHFIQTEPPPPPENPEQGER